MRRTKTVAAVCFLAILGACLLAVLAGAAGVALGWKLPVAVSPYQGEPTYSGVAEWFKDTCRAFCTTELPGREKLMEANAALNKAAGKWIFENTEPEVVRLENGYLESAGNFFYYLTRPDETVADFSRWVEETLDCPYLYIQAPAKLCALDQEEQLPLPEMTNANDQTDWLLAHLAELGVDTLDLRQRLHQDGLDHYQCFYVTDHHWTMDTGLWAAGVMAEELSARYGLAMDLGPLDPTLYERRVWEDAFLGSQGRKVTLSYAQPEDFILPVPAFAADLRLTVPPWGSDFSGGFEILYNEAAIPSPDYYRSNSYGAVLMGDCPYVAVENRARPEGPVVAILRESFAIAPGPYLSLSAGEVHFIDARYYQGSVKDLLEEIQPDIVVSLLNAQCQVDGYFGLVK